MRKNACMLENPISANQMYAPIARGKMVKSKKYNLWIEKNLPLVKDQMAVIESFPINLEIMILANHLWRMKHDSDNLVKPLIDLLVKAEIIPDDTSRYIENINVRYLYMSGPPTVRISYDFVE